MMNELEALVTLFLLAIAGIVYLYSRRPIVITQECDCGEHDSCVSPITVHRSGSLSRKPSELLKCGKVRKRIIQFDKVMNGRRVKPKRVDKTFGEMAHITFKRHDKSFEALSDGQPHIGNTNFGFE